MTLGQGLILGIVQGFAEFLPISSSAHLIVIPWALGWPEHALAFDVALHLGTLVAVLTAFASDWWGLVSSLARGTLRGRPFEEPEARLLRTLVLASIPGAIAGLLLDKWAETTFRSPALIAGTMTVMGAVLLVGDRRIEGGPGRTGVTTKDALIIGTAQALALIPGVSRSGAAITMALFLGYRREEAARFSFLLATPIIFGAALVKVPHLMAGEALGPVLAGMAAAALVGFLSIRVLLAYVRTKDYRPFVYYRWAFAAAVLLLLAQRTAGAGG
jgi:undecaprenyl-diphosphatase